MEVLFVSHKLPPSIGGMEKQSYELVMGMSKLAKVHQLVFKGQESKLMFFIKLRFRIRRILKKHPKISIVHFNDGVMAIFGLYLSKNKNLKTAATVHGLDVVFPNLLFRRLLFPKFNLLDKVICVSKFTAEACAERGIEVSKLEVINNGVDHGFSKVSTDTKALDEVKGLLHFKPQNKKIILSLGRAVKRKGFSWFIQQVVPKLSDDYIFVMVGPIKFRKRFSKYLFYRLPQSIQHQMNLFTGWPTDSNLISELLNEPKYIGKIFHMGKVSYEKLIALFDLADIFIMPNIKVHGDAEGFGLVALEASLRSKFVLASNLEGIKDAIIDGKNGFLVEASDADAWPQIINQLCNNQEHLIKLGEAGRDFTIANFGWDKMVREYFELFQSLDAEPIT